MAPAPCLQSATAFRLDARSDKLASLLASGGDERIALDPVTQRNRYGTTILPAPNEIWFSSSTATTISPRGFEAASRAFDAYLEDATMQGVGDWFESLRRRISDLFDGKAEAILCASGTEAEILTLTVARTLRPGPLRNIIVGSRETGNGVARAAVGSYFDNQTTFRKNVTTGDRLSGWEDAHIAASNIEVRDANGRPKSEQALDLEVACCIKDALAQGEQILLHVMDASKTGVGGPSRALASEIAREIPSRVTVVVDACQLRCSFDEISADLDRGFLVMITGSKFAAGPPFCGALLVPKQYMPQLRHLDAPPGLDAYAALFDWPKSLHASLGAKRFAIANFGLGLRWEASLAEIEAYVAIAPAVRRRIVAAFGDAVRRNLAMRPRLRMLDANRPPETGGTLPTIFSIITESGDKAETELIYRALRTPVPRASFAASRICHVGQPVPVANSAALRVCVSMPWITSITNRLEGGMTLPHAARVMTRDLEALFEKWDYVGAALQDEAGRRHFSQPSAI